MNKYQKQDNENDDEEEFDEDIKERRKRRMKNKRKFNRRSVKDSHLPRLRGPKRKPKRRQNWDAEEFDFADDEWENGN